MSEGDYAAFVARALFLDRPDPVAAWRELQRPPGGDGRAAWRRRARSGSRPTAPTCASASRVAPGSTPTARHNMPSGEVFTGPIEDSANGTIRFTVPSSPRGVDVAGVELTFEDGKVVAATRRAGRGLPRGRARHRPRARASSASSGSARTPASTAHRLDPARREDGRNGAPRARPLLSRDRRRERLGPALGSDLRPSRRRRPPDRRRRAGRSSRLWTDASSRRRNGPGPECSSFRDEHAPDQDRRHHRPASRDPETLARMAEAGMDVARLNFSHGNREVHAENAELVRRAASAAGRQVAISRTSRPEAPDRRARGRHRRAQARREARARCAVGPSPATAR